MMTRRLAAISASVASHNKRASWRTWFARAHKRTAAKSSRRYASASGPESSQAGTEINSQSRKSEITHAEARRGHGADVNSCCIQSMVSPVRQEYRQQAE